MVKGTAGPGVYSATYSNIPVYEYQFGADLKEHVMRRRHDDWINATHILKAAGFDKPARTRILEREVQKDVHEKIQGGYGKYQGTWVPLEAGEALAHRNGVYEKLSTIFTFVPGNDSPPPAPKHTTNKPKIPKKPAVPKFHSRPAPVPKRMDDDYDNISQQLNDDETPDDTTVASASFLGDDDRYDMSQPSTGHRKRKRDDQPVPTLHEQNHTAYADDLLDYFMLSQAEEPATRPEPPPNFQPDWHIDQDSHSAMHWACAMGDIDVMKQLKRFNANQLARNVRGETPLMRAVLFTNCHDKQTFPKMVHELFTTVEAVDYCGATVIHHCAAITSSKIKLQCARYYLDVILNKLSETKESEEVQRILDIPDMDSNTAIHIAAKNKSRKCVRALIGRGASTDIPNSEGFTAEELIQDMNTSQRDPRRLQASSSPFAPDSQRHISFHEPIMEYEQRSSRHPKSHHSEAAMTMESKVTPLILEKFHDLAKSFDEELIDRDHSEKEAKRILNSTCVELSVLREQISELGAAENNPDLFAVEEEELESEKQAILSLIEQQQQLRLASSIQQEESMLNGHHMGSSPSSSPDESQEKVDLFLRLEEERRKRQELVDEYANATAMAGMGEKGELYRKVVTKCLGLREEEVDAQVDSLIAILEEDGEGAVVGDEGVPRMSTEVMMLQ